jgi:hypothetical protein
MAKLDFTKPISFIGEAMGSSTSQLVNTQIRLNSRKAEIIVEWEQLSAQQNLVDLKEQNRERIEEDFERSGVEYGDENEEKFNELLREFQSSLDAGNDLIWIVREKERLALEYANIVLIETPKLRIKEFIARQNFEVAERVQGFFEDIRDLVTDIAEQLSSLQEQVSNVPFPYGPPLSFILSEIIKYIEVNIITPLITSVQLLISSRTGLQGVLSGRGINL